MENTMKAPIKETTLPITGYKVEFKIWLTKKESEEVREPITKKEVTIDKEGNASISHSPSVMTEMEHRLVERAVVSVNGTKDSILENCLALPESDYDFLKSEIDKVINPPKEQRAS